MGGSIERAEVGLDLDDPSHPLHAVHLMDEVPAQEALGDLGRFPARTGPDFRLTPPPPPASVAG